VDVIDLQKIAARSVPEPAQLSRLRPLRIERHAIVLMTGRTHCRGPLVARMRKKFHDILSALQVRPRRVPAQSFGPQLDASVNSLVDLKRKQYLRTTGRDFLADPGVYDFYRR